MPDAVARLQSVLGDRYAVKDTLGSGGMATVYLADDLRHGRPVAIKVLRPELAQSLSGGRFVREIGITARLNHPHILALLDSGESAEGDILYYVMPLATGESLRERLGREGALPVREALRLAVEVVEALAHAHAHDVVHRDIKPDNVLLSGGHAVVADFGIAKAVGDARETIALTTEGTSLGTPVYMAPEQASADGVIDHRADLYAVGVLLWEMLAGAPPFTGKWPRIMSAKMTGDVPALATRRPDAPARVVALIDRCMQVDPGDRPQDAAALLAELREISDALAPGAPARSRRSTLGIAVAAVLLLAVVAAVLVRDRRVRWVHETAIPEIRRLTDADALDSAYALAERAAARAPGDSTVEALWSDLSQTQRFLSEPEGALVTRASVDDTTRWVRVGVTPTGPVRIPANAWFYRYSREGHRDVTVMGARVGGSYVPIPSTVTLRRLADPDSDMVQLSGEGLVPTLYGITNYDTLDVADFLMDKLEVTNRQYKAFVDAGGYADRAWWDSTFRFDGRVLEWRAAMARFTDRTGRPGPSTWVAGAPPPESDDLPVGGVSWYEARAYARFAGKELPTLIEWNEAAIPDAARWVVPHGRFESTSPVRGGAARGISPRGIHDMAGNVREWTVNEREPGSRYILGGGYSDPAYLYSEAYVQPESDRAAINGIRLVRRLGTGKDFARASGPLPRIARDVRTLRPVDDATFRGFLALYDYDRTPLNATLDGRDTTAADWIREDVTIDLPKGGDRLPVVVFLPKRTAPPYQTVVIFPASDALHLADATQLSLWNVDYLVRSGRAVVYPVYEHTYGRGRRVTADVQRATIEHRDQMIRWATEMRRAIDYAVARPDIDSTRLAYAGTSWGGRVGGVMMAVEPRFRAGVLNVAGLGAPMVRPEEDPVNFLPRVRIPVLMLSGRYDSVFPLESSQRPFFRLLGSPPGTKRHLLFEGGHFLPRTSLVEEALTWFDRYLGPVARER
ncbi:MAG: protein kinase [Gemmatimonadales bacterium]|nr:protein kinase [Gemmatimonadales bacterium]